jgi:hypothetical protein
MDEQAAPTRLDHLVTDEDYVALLVIEARVVAEHAAIGHTRLPADAREAD